MVRLKLACGAEYIVEDYATPNKITLIIDTLTADEVIAKLTDENLREVRFLSAAGDLIGRYKNMLLRAYIGNGDTLTINIIEEDLFRHGLVLDENNRITSAPLQRYAPDGVEIVDELPDGNITDYLRIDGEYIYDPLPEPEQTEPTPTIEERVTTLEQKVDGELADQEEALNLLGVYV